jgi:hypothetical protein
MSTFSSKSFYFVTVSDSPVTHNLSGQSKKVGCGCPHCFRETDSSYLSEPRKTLYKGYRRYIPMKHQFGSMKDQFNGNTENIRPPPHLIHHEVYEMVKVVHVNMIRKACIRIVVCVLMLMMLQTKTKTCTMVKYMRYGSLTFTVSRFLFFIVTGLMQSRVL